MHEKRYRITLLFNANKVYDRQVVEGVGEYLQASQTDWDIFIEEDFRCANRHKGENRCMPFYSLTRVCAWRLRWPQPASR
ncbi:hypothetical protein E05_28280 [Plautia stali symbiont]|nr:hypothetical protein E05_28280 [Plautia stali symbiont]